MGDGPQNERQRQHKLPIDIDDITLPSDSPQTVVRISPSAEWQREGDEEIARATLRQNCAIELMLEPLQVMVIEHIPATTRLIIMCWHPPLAESDALCIMHSASHSASREGR